MDIRLLLEILLVAAGVIVTYVFARRSRQVPVLGSAIDFDVLLDPGEQLVARGLKMELEGSDVSRVSRTRLAIWHVRGDTVDYERVIASDALRLQFAEDERPLQARVVTSSRSQIELDWELGTR